MNEIPLMSAGYPWQKLSIGQKMRTFKRTITETDITNFVTSTGQLAPVFIDSTINDGVVNGRPAPGALTYVLSEGLGSMGMLRGTVQMLLEVQKKMHAPVMQGDTIWAEVEITDIKPTPLSHGAIVTSKINVKNQDEVVVMTYTATRIISSVVHG